MESAEAAPEAANPDTPEKIIVAGTPCSMGHTASARCALSLS